MARTRSAILSVAVLAAVACCGLRSTAFIAPRGQAQTPTAPPSQAQLAAAGLFLATAPAPAHAGGMFDFGLTLPFVAGTFLLMMVTLNALFYSPVSTEMEDRDAKLLKTLSDATDMLSKADGIQVTYTAQIREAREKASEAVKEYRAKTEAAVSAQIASAQADRDMKAKALRAKLEADVDAKKQAAESEIKKRQDAFVKETMVAVGL